MKLSLFHPGQAMLPGAATLWQLQHGQHPGLPEVSVMMASVKPEAIKTPEVEGLPLMMQHRGHHMMTDEGYLAAAGEVDHWPLAPVYVRDIAGRVLHTGLQPLPRSEHPLLTPEGCRVVNQNDAEPALVESVFMVELRRLEMAASPGVMQDQTETTVHALYASAQRYPYKLRVDSFYQDGFRLPQVTRLHVQPGVPALAQAAAEDFMRRWQERPSEQTYEEFYEKNQGAVWFEELFQQGCTVIPTVEGYNGFFAVTPDFGMADVHPGRAIKGLHEVVSKKVSAEPEGTILQVVTPGYATRQTIKPAQVVVSDGSQWQSGFAENPAPLLPNLRLPHPRVGGNWGDVWLPTHPTHFIRPALWDWSADGFFEQVSGPLWDPVHYVYASTSKILRALRRMPHGFASVPEDMKPRFHPVIAMTSYDTHNSRTLLERQRSLPEDHLLQSTAIDTLPLGREVANLGYHPLPAALEYELDPAVFPQRGPQRFENSPESLKPRLVHPIRCVFGHDEALQHTVVMTEPETLLLKNGELFAPSAGKPAEDYPQLYRSRKELSLEAIARLMPVFLPERHQAELFPNIRRLFSRINYRHELSLIHPDLPQNLQNFAEAAASWRRRRYRAWRRFLPALLQAWWQFKTIDDCLAGGEEDASPELRSVVIAQQPLPKPQAALQTKVFSNPITP